MAPSRRVAACKVSVTCTLCTSALCTSSLRGCTISHGMGFKFAAEIGDTGEEFGVERHPLKLSGTFARDHYHRHSRRQHRAQSQPVALAHAALEPIADHGVAYPARDRDA